MKTIILVKQHPVIQLGHLYEHLFLQCVNEFFYSHGLYKSLDYGVHGTTFEHGGVITVECSLYSREAIRLGDEIEQLHIDFGKDNSNITKALFQIAAEEPYVPYVSNRKTVTEELSRLDNQPWRSVDSIDILDTKAIRRKNKLLYLTHQKQIKPRQIQVTISLDRDFANSHREILPLFVFVGRVILLTASNRTCAAHGLYSGELYPKTYTSLTSELLVSKQGSLNVSIETMSDVVKETTLQVLNHATYTRLEDELSSVRYELGSNVMPNFEDILTQTGILMGAIGWRKTATIDNIKLLLEHTSIEIKFGRDKASWPILRP